MENALQNSFLSAILDKSLNPNAASRLALSRLVVPGFDLSRWAFKVRNVRSAYAGATGYLFPGAGKCWEVLAWYVTYTVTGNYVLYHYCNLGSESNPLALKWGAGNRDSILFGTPLLVTYGQSLGATGDGVSTSIIQRALVKEYSFEVQREDTTS